MKPKQTLLGDKPVISRNMKRIKSTGMKFYPSKEETPESIIDDLENVHKRTKFYSLFSGGKDSMTTTHMLDQMDKLEAVVHIKNQYRFTNDYRLCKGYLSRDGLEVAHY